jgi:cytochrome d ubiquinol oxidase subunit II
VPLDSSGRFFLPLWTDFGVSGPLGILDWYTVSVGVLAFLVLTQHGALWVALKTEERVQLRARKVAGAMWFFVVTMTTLVTILSMRLQPQINVNLRENPWGYVFPAIAVIGLMAILSRGALASFLGSCAYIVGMLTSAAFGVFPYVLPGRPNANFGLTIHNTATSAYGLWVGLLWWVPGMALALGYIIFVYRHFAGKVRLEGEGY